MLSRNNFPDLTRRDCLRRGMGAAMAGLTSGSLFSGSLAASGTEIASAAKPGADASKTVAAVVTVYTHNSHADVILTKIMQGWNHDGGPGPALKLAGVYIDQPEASEFGRTICQQHHVPIFDSIEQAVTAGGQKISVDGVLSIGEHGRYPHNEIGQHLYPRRRFMEGITAAFEKYGRVVPVFNDKHLGPVWSDAQWMYERARQLKIPYMAGSSLPAGYRTSDISVPLGCDIEAAVGIGYGGVEAYGFHALELYQYHMERRAGAERGVRTVRFLEGAAAWKAVDDGVISRQAFDAAFAAVPKTGRPDPREDPQAGVFLFEYLDGLTGAVFYLSCVHGTSVGLKRKDQSAAIATAFDERTEPRYPHFAFLLKAIESMIYTGRPAYPVERTLLTSGILDHAMKSRAAGGRLISTPELAIAYQPVDYPYARSVEQLAHPPVKSEEVAS